MKFRFTIQIKFTWHQHNKGQDTVNPQEINQNSFLCVSTWREGVNLKSIKAGAHHPFILYTYTYNADSRQGQTLTHFIFLDRTSCRQGLNVFHSRQGQFRTSISQAGTDRYRQGRSLFFNSSGTGTLPFTGWDRFTWTSYRQFRQFWQGQTFLYALVCDSISSTEFDLRHFPGLKLRYRFFGYLFAMARPIPVAIPPWTIPTTMTDETPPPDDPDRVFLSIFVDIRDLIALYDRRDIPQPNIGFESVPIFTFRCRDTLHRLVVDDVKKQITTEHLGYQIGNLHHFAVAMVKRPPHVITASTHSTKVSCLIR